MNVRELEAMARPGEEITLCRVDTTRDEVDRSQDGRQHRSAVRTSEATAVVVLAGHVGHAGTTDVTRDGIADVVRRARDCLLPRRTSGVVPGVVGTADTYASPQWWDLDDLAGKADELRRHLGGRIRARAVRRQSRTTSTSGSLYEESTTGSWLQCRLGDGPPRVTSCAFARHPALLDAAGVVRDAEGRVVAGRRWTGAVDDRRITWMPAATRTLLAVVGASLLGGAGGRTRLGPIGDVVAAEAVTLVDDGTAAHGPASAVRDAELTPTGTTTLITGGTLTRALHDRVTAALAGTASTGNSVYVGGSSRRALGPTNLRLAGTTSEPERSPLVIEELTGVTSEAIGGGGTVAAGFTGTWTGRPLFGSIHLDVRDWLREIREVGELSSYSLASGGIAGAIVTTSTGRTGTVRAA